MQSIENQLLPGNKFKYAEDIPYAILKNDVETNNYMIFFHGNGEHMGHCCDLANTVIGYLNTNAILIEYPGYGMYQSQKPSAILVKQKALEAFNKIKEEYKLTNQTAYVFGRSIGSGPAFYLAANTDIAGLISLSAFRSLPAFIAEIPQFKKLQEDMSDNLNNEEEISKIKCPTLLIHGDQDTLIPCQHSEDIYKKAKNSSDQQIVKLSIIPGMGHNDIYLFVEQICQAISETFKNLSL